MHWNLVSNMPLSQSLWFSLDSLLPHSFPPKQNSGVGGVWSPLGASAEPLPHPTLASAHQDAIISGAMTITWSRKALFRYVYISYNKFTPLLILLFTMNMAKVKRASAPSAGRHYQWRGHHFVMRRRTKAKDMQQVRTSLHNATQSKQSPSLRIPCIVFMRGEAANFFSCCSFYTGTLIDNPKS